MMTNPAELWLMMVQFMKDKNINDVHMMPDTEGSFFNFRNKKGVLEEWFYFKKNEAMLILNYIKSLAGIDLTVQRKPQEGLIQMDGCGFRISCCPVVFGEKVAIRRLHVDSSFANTVCQQLDNAVECIQKHLGLFLIIGSTGSGKTFSLSNIVDRLACKGFHVVSLEQPVEISHSASSQIPLQSGQTFSDWSNVILRQDPDVIVLGELRNEEDCQIALQLVRTGHPLITTIHGSDVFDALERFNLLGYASKWIQSHLSGYLRVKKHKSDYQRFLVTKEEWRKKTLHRKR